MEVKFIGKHKLVPFGTLGIILKEIKGDEYFVKFHMTAEDNPALIEMGFDPDNPLEVTFTRPRKEFQLVGA